MKMVPFIVIYSVVQTALRYTVLNYYDKYYRVSYTLHTGIPIYTVAYVVASLRYIGNLRYI